MQLARHAILLQSAWGHHRNITCLTALYCASILYSTSYTPVLHNTLSLLYYPGCLCITHHRQYDKTNHLTALYCIMVLRNSTSLPTWQCLPHCAQCVVLQYTLLHFWLHCTGAAALPSRLLTLLHLCRVQAPRACYCSTHRSSICSALPQFHLRHQLPSNPRLFQLSSPLQLQH
jgi:hypothetical protein